MGKLIGAALGLVLVGCTTSVPKPDANPSRVAQTDELDRHLAFNPVAEVPFATTAFGKQLAKLKLIPYGANLHAHHFMGVRGSKKNPLTLEQATTPGPCRAEKGTYPMDDGHPCRDENGLENQTIGSRVPIDYAAENPDVSDYFRQACEYGTHEGELDILFLTPHTKNNGVNENGQLVTSTSAAEVMKRQEMLASMNPARLTKPKFLCGLGQEASSISTGNHINIFGQFHAGAAGEKPFFFPPGDFKSLYTAVKERNAAGGKVFLQMNHPDVLNDYFTDTFAQIASTNAKKSDLNDYGLDDYAPMGCLTGRLASDAPECADVSPAERPTNDLFRKTFANIRTASGDPFRLIEIIPPGAGKEGEADTNGDGAADTQGDVSFGATTNTKTNFRRVQHRKDADTYEPGVYDFAFYLSMGFKLGPTANQDNHHMNWGSATASRTGVLAADLKEATVLGALAARHVFASEDKNARILLSQLTGTTRKLMGDTVKVATPATKIQVSYYDPDGEENGAHVRLYYYRAGEAIDFTPIVTKYTGPDGREKTRKDPPKGAFHTVSFDAKNAIRLPASTATDRSDHDLIPIRSGDVLSLNLPVEKGIQWIFAEVIQDGDFDKIWSAPIWIERK